MVDLQIVVQFELSQVLEHGFAAEVLLLKHHLDLTWAHHVLKDRNELLVQAVEDKLDAQGQAAKLLFRFLQDFGQDDHDH